MAAPRTGRAAAGSPAPPVPKDDLVAGPAVREKLAKLGIASKLDLALHLPLRYEDETRLTPIAAAGTGEPVLVEAVVVECEVKYRPRRTLVVKLTDGASDLWARFLNFYPSQVKQMAEGRRLRLYGEVRPGFFGAEMVHPKVRVVDEGAPLPQSLTPVYPTTAGLSQANLRGFIDHALDTLLLDDTLEPALLERLALGPFRESVLLLHRPPPQALDAEAALADTIAYWEQWSARCRYRGSRRAPVIRSLLTLKALTFEETGGIVAAPTTSLPEQPGGTRNWDYRFCWLRDATLTLIALMGAGYYDEAQAWRDWLHRSVAGSPHDLQIMYGLSGERRLPEWEVGWLPGHRGAAPVRVGNAASMQIQLDVWGEMMDALHLAREGGLAPLPSAWALQCGALRHLERIWDQPDEGIWEVRGGRRQFVHSKVMAWVAFDRMIRDATKYELDAPVAHWCDVRDLIHHTVCEQGWDPARGSFTQSFGSRELDASLLMIPLTGFLSIDDPRVTATVAAIERELVRDGLVIRYRTESGADGLPPGEGVFLTCSLWLADVYELQGRVLEADALLDRVLSHANDLGLLSEEYDPRSGALVGNFPQALSHMALIRTAMGISEHLPVRSRLESPPTTPDG